MNLNHHWILIIDAFVFACLCIDTHKNTLQDLKKQLIALKQLIEVEEEEVDIDSLFQ
jgi:hypothetical protein